MVFMLCREFSPYIKAVSFKMVKEKQSTKNRSQTFDKQTF